MGRDISKLDYCPSDFDTFNQRLDGQLEQLKSILKQPNFGQGELKIGAELELYLVDHEAQVSCQNQALIADLNDEHFQPELNSYNLELNLDAVAIAGESLSALREQLLAKTGYLEQVAAKRDINIVPLGILPTLTKAHLNQQYMTDIPRYHCLANYLLQQRGAAFHININGEQPVSANFDDICAEGANTSFQVHLMTPLEEFCDVFNAAQLTAPLVTAIAANSPILLGNRVWDETRIALFKQALDIRAEQNLAWRVPTRVNFGLGWSRGDVWDLFAESVALYPPIMPELFQANTRGLPELSELCLHAGTVWPWNRPVYSAQGNGHVRLEFRSIPAGPTSLDMVANAALAIGLAYGLKDSIRDLIAVMPFDFAEYNFYRAAQLGLDAEIQWPINNRYRPEPVEITKVIAALLPVAETGLQQLNVAQQDIKQYLGIIEQRLQQRITGAVWQKNMHRYLETIMDKHNANRVLVQKYVHLCRSCQPVATWERPWL